MTKMPGEYKYKKKVCALSACAVFLSIAYLAFFSMTIFNTLEYQRSEKAISTMTTELSRIEFAYLSKEATVNTSLAESLGFVEPTNIVIARESKSIETAFVSKQSLTK